MTKIKVIPSNFELRELPQALEDMNLRFMSPNAGIIRKHYRDVTTEDWLNLVDGRVAFLVIEDAIHPIVCDQVAAMVDLHAMQGYKAVESFKKAQDTMPYFEGKGAEQEYYAWAPDSHNPDFIGGMPFEHPGTTIRRICDNTFQHGACLARLDGIRAMPFGLIRGLMGGTPGVYIHSDSMVLDHPEVGYFETSRAAISIVAGLTDYGEGGETVIYPVELLDNSDREKIMNSDGSIEESLIPPPAATYKLKKTEVIAFNSQFLHQVLPVKNIGDIRLTCSGFALYREDGENSPLALFS